MKKSVLFISVDQWRWDCFGFMKNKYAVTPNIDKLAKQGVYFKSHFAGIIPCGPARTTMLTGLYPFIHRSTRNGSPLDKRFTNIAKEIKRAGYTPKLFGYTDTTWDPRYLNDNDKKKFTYESPMEGFDPVCHLPESNPEPWYKYLLSKGYKYKNAKQLYKRDYPKKGEAFTYKAWDIKAEDSDTSFLANQVIKHLKKTTDPFFYHVSFLRPHPPMFVSEPWHSLINPSKIKLPLNNLNYKKMLSGHPMLREIGRKFMDEKKYKEIRFNELKSEDVKKIIAVYLGMCAEVDYNIGKILDTLKIKNIEKNTLVIFTSDHGELLGENNLWGKLGWWDSAYRIPLIFFNKNLKARKINDFTESVDLAPTILEWLGLNTPINWSGISLLQYLKTGKNKFNKNFVIFEFDFRESNYSKFVEEKILEPEECNLVCIRDKKWKYVHFPTLPSLLFNLKKDPLEKKNLSNIKKYQKIKNELLSKLLSHRLLHQERQLSSMQVSSSGVSTSYGNSLRKMVK